MAIKVSISKQSGIRKSLSFVFEQALTHVRSGFWGEEDPDDGVLGDRGERGIDGKNIPD